MFALLQFIIGFLSIDPLPATQVAAQLVGEPQLANELEVVCTRESKCARIGLHDRDRWAGKSMHRNAMRVGWLDSWCPWHVGPDDPERFSVRGSFGLSAAYSLRFLGPCLPPELLDIPVISAFAAARRMVSQCEEHGACGRKDYRRFWAGARRYDKREANQKAAPKQARNRQERKANEAT